MSRVSALSVESASLVSPSQYVKNLGVTMDSRLTFEKHINDLCNKANGILYFLNRQKDLLNATSRICVVEALVNNLFSYCSIIWSACKKNSIMKIQRVQNFAAKIADGEGRKFDRATPYIRKLGWLKMNEKIHYNILSFIFKLTRGVMPEWVLNMQTVGEQQRRLTRQAHNFVIPRTRTKIAENSMKVKGARLWNNLPQYIKNTENQFTFKREIKRHLTLNSV